jgi:hypothetical protein
MLHSSVDEEKLWVNRTLLSVEFIVLCDQLSVALPLIL